MQIQNSPNTLDHLTTAAGATLYFVGYTGFTACHLAYATFNLITIPGFPLSGTIGTAKSLWNAGVSTISALQSGGDALGHTIRAVSNLAVPVIQDANRLLSKLDSN